MVSASLRSPFYSRRPPGRSPISRTKTHFCLRFVFVNGWLPVITKLKVVSPFTSILFPHLQSASIIGVGNKKLQFVLKDYDWYYQSKRLNCNFGYGYNYIIHLYFGQREMVVEEWYEMVWMGWQKQILIDCRIFISICSLCCCSCRSSVTFSIFNGPDETGNLGTIRSRHRFADLACSWCNLQPDLPVSPKQAKMTRWLTKYEATNCMAFATYF